MYTPGLQYTGIKHGRAKLVPTILKIYGRQIVSPTLNNKGANINRQTKKASIGDAFVCV